MRAAMADDIVISGTVVNGITGDPIPKASVVLQGFAEQVQAGPPKHVRATTTTGLAGEFRFTAPKGHYQPTASKAGFSGRWFGEAPRNQTGQKSEENLRIPLFPFGVVEGKVTDQDGEPVRYAHVTALQRIADNGILRYHTAREVATDDLGEFRLWNMPPGDYFIRAGGRSGGTSITMGDSLSSGTRVLESFHTQYADGARDLAGSSPIRIGFGTSVKAEFRVHMEPAFAISGTLTGVPKGESPTFEIVRAGVPVSRHRAAYLPLTLQVAGASLTNVVWSLPESVSARGVELVFRPQADEVPSSGPLPLPPGIRNGPRTSSMSNSCNWQVVSLNPFSLAQPAFAKPPANSDGGPLVDGLMPGRYQLLVTCGVGYAVPSGDTRDTVSNGLWFVDVPQEGPAIIRLEANHYTQSASVEVQCASCRTVLLVPVSSQSLLLQTARCHQGRCGSPPLAPGDYVIHGIGKSPGDGDEEAIGYRDPKTLAALQGGMRITVAKGDRKVIEIQELSK